MHLVSKFDQGNKLGYPFLVYINDDHGPPFSVVWYNNRWHECQHDRRTREPYLGRIRREVSEGDVPTTMGEDTPDEAEQSERPEDSEDEPTNQETRHAPAIIDPSGPGSPYCHRRTRNCLGGELGPTSCGRRCTGGGGVVGCHLGRWINCLHLERLH